MARIRSRNTGPEIRLRQALWAEGFRYRLNSRLPGRPDIVFAREQVAIFVDGCFWHGCPVHYSPPLTRHDFWKEKLRKNVLRDIAADDALKSEGWQVVRIWQHELSDMENVVRRIGGLLEKSQHSEKYEKFRIYKADASAIGNISEPTSNYGDSKVWWICGCGSKDVQVLESERPAQNPGYAELICRKCRRIWRTLRPL